MSEAAPLTAMLLAVVSLFTVVSGHQTRLPKSLTYQSSSFTNEKSPQNYQLLPVRKSINSKYGIFTPAKTQTISVKGLAQPGSSVAGYIKDINEERKQFLGLARKTSSRPVRSNTVAGENMFDKHRNVGDRKQDDTMLACVDTNMEKSTSQGNPFRCGPCYCSYIRKKFVGANCVQLNLTAVPRKLPNNIRALTMSLNIIQSFDKTSLLQYPNLTDLDFSRCLISIIANASFAFMPQLINLTLKHNKLTYLSKSSFTGLECLQSLDVSSNNISKIEIGTFDQLRHLCKLNLSGNKYLGYSNETFSHVLFVKLENLQMLHIHDNTNGTEISYPNKALQQLKALQNLSIDGLAGLVEFGREMKDLTGLVHLEIRGICKIENITANFFENVPYLQCLLIDGCADLQNIHPEAYRNLWRLQSLVLTYLPSVRIDTVFEAMISLNNSGLKSLTFRHLRRYINVCTNLNIEQAKYITNINLHRFELSNINIAELTSDFFIGLPTTLKELILTGNKFAFSTGKHTWSYYSVLKELVYLDLSMQNTNEFHNRYNSNVVEDSSGLQWAPGTERLVTNEERTISYEKRDNIAQMHGYSENIKANSHLNDHAIYGYSRSVDEGCEIRHHTGNYLNFPPNLRTLKASHYQAFGMTILTYDIPEYNSLYEIDFRNSFMSIWGFGKMPRGIVIANLGENYCRKICSGFFQPNNSHEQLLLHDNLFGNNFAKDELGSIFAELTKTTYLDISRNLIYHLPRQFFKGLINLNYLSISDNRLPRLGISFGHMSKLQFIDLSKNAIRWIDEETRNDLDAIASLSGHKIKLDLTMNPLPCTCAGLDVITWMATTKVHFHKAHLLTCDSDDISTELIGDLEEKRKTLQRLCMSKSTLTLGCVAALTVVMITAGLGLMYRYRWKLRYLHNIANAAVFGFKPDLLPKSGCTFDAYIVYTKETRDFVTETCIKELELKRGHRLCVEDRDFLAGTYTVSNIVSAVRNSTKTVPVMTPTFYNGLFSEYSFKMAVMEELYKNRSVLHLLIYQAIANEQMSHDELKVMKRNSYIEYPPEEGTDGNIRQKFWDDLSLAIGHTRNPTTQQLPVMQ